MAQDLKSYKNNNGSLCLVDSVATHIILYEKKYFVHPLKVEGKVSTISSVSNLIKSSKRAIIILPMRKKIWYPWGILFYKITA